MRHVIANAISRAYTRCLRTFFGIQIPSARIRHHNLWTERNFICEEIRQSVQTTSALMIKLALIDKEIVDQHAEIIRLKKSQDQLRTPAQNQPIGDL